MLAVSVLVFNALCIFLAISIRVGFLADAFSKREIPGRLYGAMEGSILLGNLVVFTSGCSPVLLARFTSRTLIVGCSVVMSTVMLSTGLTYLAQSTTTVLVLSTVLRITQGLLGYFIFIVYIDFVNAQFPEHFDVVNGLLNMGIFVGHGVAESVGCVLYDKFGYLVPYLFGSAVTMAAGLLAFLVLPSSCTYLASQPKQAEGEKRTVKLSKMHALPMLAMLFINATCGYLQVSILSFYVMNSTANLPTEQHLEMTKMLFAVNNIFSI